ncbi:hypothetical protein FLG15_03705 [Xanthomonas phaseoli pv. dieffenbachiae]|uniref:Uncharacterized protein n=1 Tax=Xanthomonas phaseoli pv. dieffenbachiae TaxID=92828 RepID=A0A1V9HES3_9XANT|nr:hypothetical protein IM53_004360 [Xanthomonas phaseoli pv. dieffenbachiae]
MRTASMDRRHALQSARLVRRRAPRWANDAGSGARLRAPHLTSTDSIRPQHHRHWPAVFAVGQVD